tara:strand:+ start:390 stop:674 length:285 start_codon:yes stop_codon:yes gene_type:complete
MSDRTKELRQLQELERAESSEPNYPDDVEPRKVRFGTDPEPYGLPTCEEVYWRGIDNDGPPSARLTSVWDRDYSGFDEPEDDDTYGPYYGGVRR